MPKTWYGQLHANHYPFILSLWPSVSSSFVFTLTWRYDDLSRQYDQLNKIIWVRFLLKFTVTHSYQDCRFGANELLDFFDHVRPTRGSSAIVRWPQVEGTRKQARKKAREEKRKKAKKGRREKGREGGRTSRSSLASLRTLGKGVWRAQSPSRVRSRSRSSSLLFAHTRRLRSHRRGWSGAAQCRKLKPN